ncbi:MAG: diguanylate cyclase [Desulfobulbaceae bacterium]|nr:diguanylate cyclase [Desulfobulbaceae bacterium]
MQLEPKRYIYIVILLWVAGIVTSLSWNLLQMKNSAENAHQKTAKAFVQQISLTRAWNASHKGVYLRVSETLHPNPFLQVSNRDVTTTDGTSLTLINPAFMTRMISDIAQDQGDIKFHMTSLKPINPENKPSQWERDGLLFFEKEKTQDYFNTDKQNGKDIFNYMVPLVTKKSCLQCHAKQGYKEGDIRGGVRVSFQIQKVEFSTLIISHLFLLCAGTLVLAGFGNQIIKLTATLKKQSNIDGLTQIANRRFFDITLHREWLRSRRLKSPLSLIMCDIDHFKLYNDNYGHQAGDICLKKVAQALKGAAKRPEDLVARYGGEEFVIILPKTPAEGAKVMAEQAREAVESLKIEHCANNIAEHVTISLGIATQIFTQISAENDIIKNADKALYGSKESGRNIFTHFDDV